MGDARVQEIWKKVCGWRRESRKMMRKVGGGGEADPEAKH